MDQKTKRRQRKSEHGAMLAKARDEELERDLHKELVDINTLGGEVVEESIIVSKYRFLSGIPYLFSSDFGRAFVFRDKAQALDIAKRYADILPDARVVARGGK